ncbi:transcription factor IIF subunit tfg1 [Coemansia spiralis]|uniref:Transcription initiation factor IIF subunit alpha n=2 Tax=Coemansia TaxID=4863 RepID=A0A9W8KVE0_9FUNG|nr:hypothetical protein BX070DRAFT_229053 [Coemansia spiralis]KAJ1986468.1 transcription factor IIF subunit tfg1 [Coemansia umbellata]KAJ2618766.1 transcription factor IIF subunit tfg1 [Coemansia sp. RSA 1358]KAJ2668901.1 transcription factor IIF subunit tfg1 [Coemansia spiralis]
MSSGIRRPEKKPAGSAGIRTFGARPTSGSSGVVRRPQPGTAQKRQQRASAAADADIPLAAATGIAPTDSRPSIEYPLMSATPDCTHNVMRFLAAKSINLREFTQPVKLRRRNREYYRLKNKKRNEERAAALAAKAEAELKLDDKIKPEDGQKDAQPATPTNVQQLQKDQRPKADINLIADMGGARRNKKNLFKKRTKQVYFADEEKRRLDIEEARPWVLEDDDEKEMWTGSLEGGQNSSFVLFVLTDDGFKVVPVDRWYKFAPRLNYKTLTLDEAEEVLRSEQKIDNRSRWIMKKHMLKEEGIEGEENEKEKATRPPKKATLVEYEAMDDDDDDLFGGDDDEGSSRRPKKRVEGKHGDYDELNFEIEFDDDEELGDVQFEYNEEESREKDEQRRKTHISAFGSDDEEDEMEVDGASSRNDLDDDGKNLKKLIRKREESKEYESDDEVENPYLSLSEVDSDESDSDDETVKKEDDQQQAEADKGKGTADGANNTKPAAAAGRSASPSTPASTAAAAGSASGSVASSSKKRRRISSVGGPQSQAGSRAGASGSGSPVSAAGDSSSANKHFKSSSQASKAGGGASGLSKGSSTGGSSDLISKQEIIDLIKSGVNTTKELIGCVRKKLKANPENKARIQSIVKEVAMLKNDLLILKKP